jgi:hypothetical protein
VTPNPKGDKTGQIPALKRPNHGNNTSYAFHEPFLPTTISITESPLEPNYTITAPSTYNNPRHLEAENQLPPLVTPAHKSPLLFNSYDELITSRSSGQKRHLHMRAGHQFEFQSGLPLVFLFFGTGGDQHIREFE